MNGRCPFCWGRSVRRVGMSAGYRAVLGSRPLRECQECEKWFWADSQEEVPRLYEICATSLVNPGRCDEAIQDALNFGGDGFPRQRAAEFNLICSDCPGAQFVVGGTAIRA
jgi:hypothetical protein